MSNANINAYMHVKSSAYMLHEPELVNDICQAITEKVINKNDFRPHEVVVTRGKCSYLKYSVTLLSDDNGTLDIGVVDCTRRSATEFHNTDEAPKLSGADQLLLLIVNKLQVSMENANAEAGNKFHSPGPQEEITIIY